MTESLHQHVRYISVLISHQLFYKKKQTNKKKKHVHLGVSINLFESNFSKRPLKYIDERLTSFFFHLLASRRGARFPSPAPWRTSSSGASGLCYLLPPETHHRKCVTSPAEQAADKKESSLSKIRHQHPTDHNLLQCFFFFFFLFNRTW